MRNIEEIVHRQVNRWNSIAQTLHYVPGQTPNKKASMAATWAAVHPVICISRETGSGAREVAKRICERLGYELFGSAIIDEIAKDLNVQRELVDSLDERGRGELQMILETYLRGREIESQEYLGSLIRVIKTMAMKGGVVLLGRGASFILRDQSALNVLVVAPFETRVKRLMQYDHVDEETARKKILEADHQRERFVRGVFGQNIHDPSNFDLAINTNRIQPSEAAEIVFTTLEMRGFLLDELAIPALTH